MGVLLAGLNVRLGAQLGRQVGQAVLRGSALGTRLWTHRLLAPLRLVFRPIRWTFQRLTTGAWVPSGPWMAIWMLLGFASSVQDYKRLFTLTAQLLMQKEGAACKLCDTVIGLMLKFDENSPEDIECAELCPFGIAACLSVCDRLVHALKESSRYPCVSVGMCAQALASRARALIPSAPPTDSPPPPRARLSRTGRCPDLDEPPECALRMPFFACEPADMCRLVPAFPRPRCELLPGLAVWNKWKSVIGQNVGAFASALASRPSCSDPGANPNFCVAASTGLGFGCEVLTLLLVLLAFALSIHALETEGEDDDKQWLTFWIIAFCLAVLERLTDVVLSRYDGLYYGAKLLFVVWLIFFRGAERSYARFRRSFARTAELLDWIDRSIPQVQMLQRRLSVPPSSPGGSAARLSDTIARSAVGRKLARAFRTGAPLLAAAQPSAAPRLPSARAGDPEELGAPRASRSAAGLSVRSIADAARLASADSD